jgi:hypothetical protein
MNGDDAISQIGDNPTCRVGDTVQHALLGRGVVRAVSETMGLRDYFVEFKCRVSMWIFASRLTKVENVTVGDAPGQGQRTQVC